MANFKPHAAAYDYRFGQEIYKKSFSKPTYRELLRVVKKSLKAKESDTVHIYRSKRGEWGEWFEIWQLICGVPEIIKQGWS